MGNILTQYVIPGQRASNYSEQDLLQNGWEVRWIGNDRVLTVLAELGPKSRSPEYVFVYSHGNQEDILAAAQLTRCLSRVQTRAVTVVSYEYDGYGLMSDREATEEGIIRNAETVAHWVRSKYANTDAKIVFYGRSLGSATAVAGSRAIQDTCSALILQSPIVSAASTKLPQFLWGAIRAFDMFRTTGGLSAMQVPLLVMHGKLDRVVPISHGQSIFDNYKGQKRLVVLEGKHHNDIQLCGGVEQTEEVPIDIVWSFLLSVCPDRHIERSP